MLLVGSRRGVFSLRSMASASPVAVGSRALAGSASVSSGDVSRDFPAKVQLHAPRVGVRARTFLKEASGLVGLSTRHSLYSPGRSIGGPKAGLDCLIPGGSIFSRNVARKLLTVRCESTVAEKSQETAPVEKYEYQAEPENPAEFGGRVYEMMAMALAGNRNAVMSHKSDPAAEVVETEPTGEGDAEVVEASEVRTEEWNGSFSVLRKDRRAGVVDGGGSDKDQGSEKGKTFIVTTPLYYVNAAPHMGSAYPTIAADALARFQRLQGRKVVFITGTDEHGEKIATAAAAQGRQPKEHCDLVAADYQALWRTLGISYDRFIRTTEVNHEKIVDEFYRRVLDNGDIYCADYEGLYCVNCEEYKDEKELMEERQCPIHRTPCEPRKEDNHFFALSKYQQQVDALLSDNPDFVRPSFRRHEVEGWVKDGLRDFSISRAAVEWGIPVPTDTKQTIYVWFDALLGYLSALLEDGMEPSVANAEAGGWPASVHIIGKPWHAYCDQDILRFHAVYWPAMLMSAGLPVPGSVYGHGFLTKDGLKMGKSLGNTLEPKDLVERFGPDAVRYYFLKEIEFGKDGDFSEERFTNIINANLANTIGNLLNRTLGLLKKNCNATIPVDSSSIDGDNVIRKAAADIVKLAKDNFANLQFSGACEALLSLASAGNLYLDEKAPWSKFKAGGSSADEAAVVLTVVLEVVRILAVGLSPVVPELCRRIYLQLGYSDEEFGALSWENTQWGGLKAGQVMADALPIFKRIEDPDKDEVTVAQRPGAKKGKKNSKQKIVVAPTSAECIIDKPAFIPPL